MQHTCQNTDLLTSISTRVTNLEANQRTLSTNVNALVNRLDSLVNILTKIGWMILTMMFGALGYLIVKWVEA